VRETTAANDTARALKRLAEEETVALIVGLRRSRHRHRGIHEARRAIRRIRSILVFMAPKNAVRVDVLDRKLKTLALELSPLRDAHVAFELAANRAAEGAAREGEPWKDIERRLRRARDGLMKRALAEDHGFRRKIAHAEQIAVELLDLDWRVAASRLRKILARSDARAERAKTRLSRRPSLVAKHRWRRRLRRLRMQVRAIAATGYDDVRLARLVQRLPKVEKAADRIGQRLDERLLIDAIHALPWRAT
jgi:hypothetical protein